MELRKDKVLSRDTAVGGGVSSHHGRNLVSELWGFDFLCSWLGWEQLELLYQEQV
jgi:hypothetical protein